MSLPYYDNTIEFLAMDAPNYLTYGKNVKLKEHSSMRMQQYLVGDIFE